MALTGQLQGSHCALGCYLNSREFPVLERPRLVAGLSGPHMRAVAALGSASPAVQRCGAAAPSLLRVLGGARSRHGDGLPGDAEGASL